MLICFFKGLNYLQPTSAVYNVHSYAEWLQTYHVYMLAAYSTGKK